MRLIDADALFKALGIAEECKDCDHYRGWGCADRIWVDVCGAICYAPTIDAEPVVRCKDCKHFADDYVDTGFGPIPAFSCDVCELYGERLGLNHYCACGERDDDATD